MRWRRCVRKVVGFLSILLCFEENLPPFLTKFACLFFARHSRCFSSRVQVCGSGHALVHRALSEFEILAFTLHIHH